MTTTPSGPDVVFRGRIEGGSPDGLVLRYIAAAPPDYRSSFSGSGMPFANAEQAFYNTPNSGTASVSMDGSFSVQLRSPNSYYAGLGSARVPPTLHVSYSRGGVTVQSALPIGGGVPFRSLSYPRTRKGPEFYADDPDRLVRSQWDILYSSRYPDGNQEPADFWGGRPRR